MKRWFNVFFVFMLLFALSACGKNDDAILNKQDYMSSVCTKDSVNEFITAAENMQGDGLLSGYVISEENCYNVTPAQVAIETNIKIFKLSDSCASFVMIDNEIYSICESFGGYGFVNAVPCDFDNDGNKDLLVASSWGSGLHRSIVSIFNTSTRESTVVYDTSTTDTPHMDLFVATATPSFSSKDPSALPVYYQVYSADIKVNNNNFADLSYVTTGIIGTVEYQNGSIVFRSTNSEKKSIEFSTFITADNIALLSVIITVLIFVFTRRAEIRYKKHDDKKVQYLKLIKLLEIMFASTKSKSGSLELTDELRAQFFDTGASLLLYGSKKIYRLYLLFREYTTNPLIRCCKYYNSNDTLHIMSEILVTIRKEVGLSNFNSIANNEALAFFVNDISSNPIAKVDVSKSKFRIRMTRFELFMIDRSKFVWVKKFVYYFIKPIFSAFYIVLKHVIFIPLGRLLGVIFPSLKSTTDASKK